VITIPKKHKIKRWTTLNTSNADKISGKPRLKGKAKILQNYSTTGGVFIVWALQLGFFFPQRLVTQVQCIDNCTNQIFSKFKEKSQMQITCIGNFRILLCIAVLISKQRNSRKYILYTIFVHFCKYLHWKKTQIFHH
jgi:hypothetical protein